MGVHVKLITNAFGISYKKTHDYSRKKNDRKRHSSRAMLLTFIAIQTSFLLTNALCFQTMPEAIDFLFRCFEIVSRVVHILKGTCSPADLKCILYIYLSKFDAKQPHRIETKMYKVISILQAIVANCKNNKGAKGDCLFTRAGWSWPL